MQIINPRDNIAPTSQEFGGAAWVGWFGSTVNFIGSVIFAFREIHWMVFAVFCFFVSNVILALVAYRQRVWSLTTLFLAYIALDCIAFARWL